MASKPVAISGASGWAISKQLETHIQIGAEPSVVWRVITDFAALPEWNTFLRVRAGEAREGTLLEVEINVPGSKPMRFAPIVLRVLPNRELRWRGRVFMPGVFDGEHWFRMMPKADGTWFDHCEQFSGILVPFVMGSYQLRATQRAFESFNASLKARAEKVAASRMPAGAA